jgi:Lipoprotein LpqB beta-propeller domain/Sporulation and spore germination
VGERLRRSAAVGAGAVFSLLLAGCTGVPEAGAVHKTQAAQDVKGVADYLDQQAPAPQQKASQAAIVDGLLQAMSEGDITVATAFMTADFANQWAPSQQRLIFSRKDQPVEITGHGHTLWSVGFQQTALIDSSGSYRRASGPVSVTFTLSQVNGEWRVAGVSQGGMFILEQSLPQVLSPMRLFFPSQVIGPSGVPRLVPDTVFMPRNTDETHLLQQLIQGGPTRWLQPAVYVTTPPPVQVVSVLPGQNGLTTINLAHAATLSQPAIRTLEAQVAYTLTAQQDGSAQFQIFSNSQPLENPYTLASLSDGYNPDVLSATAPFYYVSDKDALVMDVRGPQSLPNNLVPGVASPAPDTKTVEMEHVGGVRRLAVSAVSSEVAGSATRSVAGVLAGPSGATLEVASIPNDADEPWTAVTIPGAKALTTPSFDATGQGLWTVATSSSGSTQLYRVPLANGFPGVPVEVAVTNAIDSKLGRITAFKLSRDGARAALVADKDKQAYVGVVSETTGPSGTVWSVTGARPVISLAAGPDIDVVWADRFRVGVVVQDPTSTTKVLHTTLYTVAADGYATPDAGTNSFTDRTQIPGTPLGATEFSGGPNLPWVASVQNHLWRQPAPDSTGDSSTVTAAPWDDIGDGTDPTYAG